MFHWREIEIMRKIWVLLFIRIRFHKLYHIICPYEKFIIWIIWLIWPISYDPTGLCYMVGSCVWFENLTEVQLMLDSTGWKENEMMVNQTLLWCWWMIWVGVIWGSMDKFIEKLPISTRSFCWKHFAPTEITKNFSWHSREYYSLIFILRIHCAPHRVLQCLLVDFPFEMDFILIIWKCETPTHLKKS